ncbi:hypothetical protein [Chryseobacterium arachidis]|nr:hypothetical protein [Chryseobacterium arachidis]
MMILNDIQCIPCDTFRKEIFHDFLLKHISDSTGKVYTINAEAQHPFTIRTRFESLFQKMIQALSLSLQGSCKVDKKKVAFVIFIKDQR